MNILKKAFASIGAILMVLFAVVPAQAEIISTPYAYVGSDESTHTCPMLNHSLFIGSRDAYTNGEVTNLQNFLQEFF